MSYPQILYFRRSSRFDWLTPPSLGQTLVLAAYWLCVTLLLTSNAVIHDAYYWERIGFRAAWISVTQVPFVFLLSGKLNVASFLLGSSYDGISWLHRWVSRTLFVTVTIHGGFFMTEWVRADFVALELQMMPMVRYGIGAWGILLWTFLTSLAPVRGKAHHIFVLQHLAAAGVLLWLLHMHVPSYAMYNIWLAIGLLALDRIMRTCLTLYRNITIRSARSRRFSNIMGRKRFGYEAEVQAFPGDVMAITIYGTSFSWKPGQHVRLWCPSISLIGAHPFTISNIATPIHDTTSPANDTTALQLFVRAKSGFTKRLHGHASHSVQQSCANPSNTAQQAIAKVFITGPYGFPPTPNCYNTVILIAASTGASFTLPLLDSILSDPGCVCRVDFVLLVQRATHAQAFLPRLVKAASHLQIARRIELRMTVFATRDANNVDANEDKFADAENGSSYENHDSATVVEHKADQKSLASSLGSENEHTEKSFMLNSDTLNRELSPATTKQPFYTETSLSDLENASTSESWQAESLQPSIPSYSRHSLNITFVRGSRPCMRHVIREPVEAAEGETLVVACGGRSLMSDVRNAVAWLSDERAVHKGTGAQGIQCWVEGCGF